MRVIALMRELNISLERIRSYEPFLVDTDYKFNVVNQLVPDEIYLQVIEIHNSQPIIEPKKKELVVFTDGETYRFNGKVKWYFNKQTNSEYGFIEKKGLPDIYFSGEHFLYSDPRNLKPNDEVVITVSKKDIDDKNEEIKAVSVNSLFQERDIKYLLYHFFSVFQHWNISNTDLILHKISELSQQIDKHLIEEIEKHIFTQIDYTKLEATQYKSLFSLFKICNIDISSSQLLEQLSPKIIFEFWLSNPELNLNFDLIKDELINFSKDKISYSYLNSVIERLGKNDRNEFLNTLLSALCSNYDDNDYTKIVSLVELYDEYNFSIQTDKFPETIQLKLWENKKIKHLPFNVVFKKLLAFKNEYYENEASKKEHSFSYKQYFDKIDNSDLKDLLARLHFEKDSINDKETFNTILFFIKHIPTYEFLEEFIITIYKKLSPYFKLLLFIEDYTDIIDYNELVIYTGLLSSKNQKLFFKKLLKLIAEQKLDLSLEDLNRITTIDYQTNEYAKEIDGVGLDFTLSIILKLITDLKNDSITRQSTIFELIANQIKSPKDLLVIDGFFEKCSGKTIIEENKNDDIPETKTYSLVKKEHLLPRFSTFCDGRKAVNNVTNKSILCNKSGFEFWWCENSQCYAICRTLHTSSDWRNYTLEDVLTILKISYNTRQYEILLNVINRVNRFLSHLTCRSCKSILKPKGKSNYAFYGVTLFSCTNQECETHSKDIYLSHCLNGQCDDIIDSRDSIKCKTAGVGGECGWYICKNCNACCSSEKLVARKSNLAKLGQEYKCHTTGHRDRGILCCSDCGHEMNEPIASVELYIKQLNWFIEQKDTNPNIIRSGQRKKDSKWWFIWARGNFSFEEYRKQIQSLFSSGFTIPDFNDKEKDNQLIAEPFEGKRSSIDKVFVCPNCDHHFDLNNKEYFDYARKTAIQKFHYNIFPQIDN